jgi:molybdopterin/thiamine biosynthesis adenylyltransferase
LSSEGELRYERHLILEGFDSGRQRALSESTVSLVGCGGVGTTVAVLLAGAGIGRLRIVDDDIVEVSNLNRQFMYTANDAGESKVEVLARRLVALNPAVEVTAIPRRLTPDNASSLLGSCDAIVEGVDNFPTRRLLNEYAVHNRLPYVHASAQGSQGEAMTVIPGVSACLECVFPKLPDTSRSSFPILSMAVSVAGAYAASEVVKLVSGYGAPLADRLCIYDLRNNVSRIVAVQRRGDCLVCGSV